MWHRERLIEFEERVKQAFLDKRIAAPVHLSGGNEDELIAIFKHVRPQDFVFSTWRSHYHALLKGIPEKWVFNQILDGRSMYLMSKPDKFMAGSIVGGMLPIACGVALANKRLGKDETVWVFVGDMAARTGIFHEFAQYCGGHALNVRVVVEDNGYSTDTPTEATWGKAWGSHNPLPISRYKYERKWPHVGVGEHVNF